MDDKFAGLLEVLDKEVELLREFMVILQREKQYMIDLSIDRLHECHNQKETIILNLRVLEDSRLDLIAAIYGSEQPTLPTLAMIIEKAPPRYKKSLDTSRSNLKSLVYSIRELSQINGILADRAISYTRNSLSFLNRLIHQLPVYLPSGKMGQHNNAGRLVCKKG